MLHTELTPGSESLPEAIAEMHAKAQPLEGKPMPQIFYMPEPRIIGTAFWDRTLHRFLIITNTEA